MRLKYVGFSYGEVGGAVQGYSYGEVGGAVHRSRLSYHTDNHLATQYLLQNP